MGKGVEKSGPVIHSDTRWCSPLHLFPIISEKETTITMVGSFQRGWSWVQSDLRAKPLLTHLQVQNGQIKSAFPGLRTSLTWGPIRMPQAEQEKWGLGFMVHLLSLHCTNPITKEEMPNALCFSQTTKNSNRNTEALSCPNLREQYTANWKRMPTNALPFYFEKQQIVRPINLKGRNYLQTKNMSKPKEALPRTC